MLDRLVRRVRGLTWPRVVVIVSKAFWLFLFCSVAGLLVENVYRLAFFGVVESRAGLLYGPFSPIYGVGGVIVAFLTWLMRSRSLPVQFVVFAAAGGIVEYCTSWALQSAFGILAWDYTGTFLSVGGRTNGAFMLAWGVLGLVCSRAAFPLYHRFVEPLVRRIPRVVTALCMALIAVDVVLTIVAFNGWYQRLSGEHVDTAVQRFLERHFDDEYMEERFETMSLYPDDALRSE